MPQLLNVLASFASRVSWPQMARGTVTSVLGRGRALCRGVLMGDQGPKIGGRLSYNHYFCDVLSPPERVRRTKIEGRLSYNHYF